MGLRPRSESAATEGSHRFTDEPGNPGTTARSVMTWINSPMIVVATGAFIVGLVGSTATGVFEKYARDGLDLLLDHIRVHGLEESIDLDKLDIGFILRTVCQPLVVVGISGMVLSGLGLVSARFNFATLFITYSVGVSVCLLGLGAVPTILFFFRSMLDDLLIPKLVNSIHTDYRGFNETNFVSQAWNLAMLAIQCCGVNDYSDFREANVWLRKLFQDGYWFELQTPLTCCNMAVKPVNDFSCAVNPSEGTSYFLKGCYWRVWSLIDVYKVYIIGLQAIVALAQLALICASIVAAVQLRRHRKKLTQNSNDEEHAQMGPTITPPMASRRLQQVIGWNHALIHPEITGVENALSDSSDNAFKPGQFPLNLSINGYSNNLSNSDPYYNIFNNHHNNDFFKNGNKKHVSNY